MKLSRKFCENHSAIVKSFNINYIKYKKILKDKTHNKNFYLKKFYLKKNIYK